MIILTLVRILLVSIVTCKHYLVEVEDGGRKVLDVSEKQEKNGSDDSKDREKEGSDYRIRIVGGQDANKNEFPWQVMLNLPKHYLAKAGNICGGTILTRDKILTAAHCIDEYHAKEIGVFPGKHDSRLTEEDYNNSHNVCKIMVPPGYNNETDPVFDLDIAVLHLCEPLKFSKGKFYPLTGAMTSLFAHC